MATGNLWQLTRNTTNDHDRRIVEEAINQTSGEASPIRRLPINVHDSHHYGFSATTKNCLPINRQASGILKYNSINQPAVGTLDFIENGRNLGIFLVTLKPACVNPSSSER
jgi:hypothetical protein